MFIRNSEMVSFTEDFFFLKASPFSYFKPLWTWYGSDMLSTPTSKFRSVDVQSLQRREIHHHPLKFIHLPLLLKARKLQISTKITETPNGKAMDWIKTREWKNNTVSILKNNHWSLWGLAGVNWGLCMLGPVSEDRLICKEWKSGL